MNSSETPLGDSVDTGGGERRATAQAYVVLAFTMACWGGNAVAGRLAVGEISPMVITSLRWAIVSVFLVSVTPRAIVAAWPELRRNWVKVVLMATFGFSVFNTLFYLSAHYTTAVNIAILQGAIPIFVVIGALVFHGTRISAIQSLGIAATLLGVAVVATKGNLGVLAAFRLNVGDALMLIACVFYSDIRWRFGTGRTCRPWYSSPPWQSWRSSPPCLCSVMRW
jgi:drug/metabolite transporter (DMT)-like permease